MHPEIWLLQVEAQFTTSIQTITVDLTKFNHVATALDNVTAGEIEAINMFPTIDD